MARHRFPAEKVPGETAYLHHLPVVGVLTGLEAVCRRLVLLWLLYFGMVDQIRMAVGMGEEMGLEG